MALPFHQSVVCPVLIGRAPVLAALERLAEQAWAGRGRTALITGEAGIGKSRVVAEMKARVRQRGMTTLEGHCFEPDRILPYGPLLDLLRSLLASRLAEDLARDLGPAARDLSKVLPELAALVPDRSPAPTVDAEQEKRRLFQALAQFLVRQSAAGPLLLVVEDLHWSDDTSLDFLLYLARRISGCPILLLLTYRDDELHACLTHFLAGLDRERLATELRLGRLPPADVETMLRAIFAGQGAVPADVRHVLCTLTEGNPFFIEETLQALLVAGDLTHADGAWQHRPPGAWRVPRSVQAAVQRRAQHLSPGARRVLTLAAVAGQRFDFALLQDLARLDEDELLQRLKELIAAQLVVEVSAEQFAFRHALTRQAISTYLLVRERRRLHRTILETLERRYADVQDAHLADLAYHAYEAEDWQRALHHARRAGEQARALHAPHEAIQQFTRALEAADHLAIAAPVGVRRARGLAYETLGEFERARADYEAVLCGALADRDQHAEWQALLDLGASWAAHDYARAGTYLRQALDLARALDDPARAHSLNRLGNWLANTGQPAEGMQAHHEALALFEALGDRQGMADTLDLLGMAHVLYGDWIAAVEYYGQAIDLFRALGNVRGLASSLAGRGPFAGPPLSETIFAALWPRDACARDLDEAAGLMRQLDWPAGQAFVGIGAGPTFASFGDFGAALAWARETLHIATEIGHQQWLAGAHSIMGEISVLMLAPDRAIEHLEAALALAREVGSPWWIGLSAADLALAYLLKGDVTRAEAALDAALLGDAPRASGPCTVAERRLVWVRGELALRRGKPAEALRIAEGLLASAPGAPREQPIPMLLKLKGEALLALGHPDAAERTLEDAKRGAVQRDVRPFLWQIHHALGRLHERRKRVEQARREFAAAREVVAALAATIGDEVQRGAFLTTALAMLPAERPPTPLRAAKQSFGGLTRREREVAALIAHGKSNREIAAVLFLGEGTVATHVSSILAKRGFASRSQIAAWATERGLGQPG